MNANGRRCRQFANGFKHLARIGRPIYHSKALGNIHQAIQAEKMKAARMAGANKKKKK